MATIGEFEALKCGMRQSKDGVVISLVVHPSDVTPELMSLPIGSRIAIRWATIEGTPAPGAEQSEGGDVDQTASATFIEKPRQPVEGNILSPSRPAKPHRKFSDLPLSQQCAIRCAEERFWQFLEDTMQEERGLFCNEFIVSDYVRYAMGIKSRSELTGGTQAGAKWQKLESAFQSWLTTQAHGDHVR